MGLLDLLTPDIKAGYVQMRELPDGRLVGVARLLFHWTMHVDIDPVGYADRYCFETSELAVSAMESWSGTGDPSGWHRRSRMG